MKLMIVMVVIFAGIGYSLYYAFKHLAQYLIDGR